MKKQIAIPIVIMLAIVFCTMPMIYYYLKSPTDNTFNDCLTCSLTMLSLGLYGLGFYIITNIKITQPNGK